MIKQNGIDWGVSQINNRKWLQ